MIDVLVANDHPVVRKGLINIITAEEDIKVCGEASNYAELMSELKFRNPNVVVLDISMPGLTGYDVMHHIKKLHPKMPVILMSALSEEIHAIQSIKAGASGFLNIFSIPEEIVQAVRKVSRGGLYVNKTFLGKHIVSATEKRKKPLSELLSQREFQVLLHLAAGKTPSHIGAELNLSPKTVSTYRTRILAKLNLKNNYEIMKYCIHNDLNVI